MNSPAKDIATHLASLGFGTVGTNIFYAEEPATPNNVITVYDTGSYGQEPVQDIRLYSPSIQVRVRNMDYDTGYTLQLALVDALILPITFENYGSRYIGIWSMGDIISIGRDANSRYLLTSNYRIERQPL